MVHSIGSRKFEDLDFNLVRDTWRLLLKYPYACWSMEELVLEMKKLGFGRDKTIITVRVLARDGLIFSSVTRVYRSVKEDKTVRGKIIVYQNHIGKEEFIKKFLSLCYSDKEVKGGIDKVE